MKKFVRTFLLLVSTFFLTSCFFEKWGTYNFVGMEPSKVYNETTLRFYDGITRQLEKTVVLDKRVTVNFADYAPQTTHTNQEFVGWSQVTNDFIPPCPYFDRGGELDIYSRFIDYSLNDSEDRHYLGMVPSNTILKGDMGDSASTASLPTTNGSFTFLGIKYYCYDGLYYYYKPAEWKKHNGTGNTHTCLTPIDYCGYADYQNYKSQACEIDGFSSASETFKDTPLVDMFSNIVLENVISYNVDGDFASSINDLTKQDINISGYLQARGFQLGGSDIPIWTKQGIYYLSSKTLVPNAQIVNQKALVFPTIAYEYEPTVTFTLHFVTPGADPAYAVPDMTVSAKSSGVWINLPVPQYGDFVKHYEEGYEEGNDFAYWEDEDGTRTYENTQYHVTKDMTFTAHWEYVERPVEQTIHYDLDDKGTISNNTPKTALHGSYNVVIYDAIPNSPRYQFYGWFKNPERTQPLRTGTDSMNRTIYYIDEIYYGITVYAEWAITMLTIDYGTNDYDVRNRTYFDYGCDPITLYPSTIKGTNHIDWYDLDDHILLNNVITNTTRNYHLRPEVEYINYNITYDIPTDAKVTGLDSATKTYNLSTHHTYSDLTFPTVSKDGYTFNGWKANGVTISMSGELPCEDLVLTPRLSEVTSGILLQYNLPDGVHFTEENPAVTYIAPGSTVRLNVPVDDAGHVVCLRCTSIEGFKYPYEITAKANQLKHYTIEAQVVHVSKKKGHYLTNCPICGTKVRDNVYSASGNSITMGGVAYQNVTNSTLMYKTTSYDSLKEIVGTPTSMPSNWVLDNSRGLENIYYHDILDYVSGAEVYDVRLVLKEGQTDPIMLRYDTIVWDRLSDGRYVSKMMIDCTKYDSDGSFDYEQSFIKNYIENNLLSTIFNTQEMAYLEQFDYNVKSYTDLENDVYESTTINNKYISLPSSDDELEDTSGLYGKTGYFTIFGGEYKHATTDRLFESGVYKPLTGFSTKETLDTTNNVYYIRPIVRIVIS